MGPLFPHFSSGAPSQVAVRQILRFFVQALVKGFPAINEPLFDPCEAMSALALITSALPPTTDIPRPTLDFRF